MNREEILDMAMDIFENTDATLEEAMGIALESAENKMSDAEKYRRRLLKAKVPLANDIDTTYRRNMALTTVPWQRDSAEYRGYRDLRPGQKIDAGHDAYVAKSKYEKEIWKDDKNPYAKTSRERRVALAKSANQNKIQSNMKKYGHPYQTKEAAIMDTALDYMDMYDVSMEEAIDMAYEDYEY